MKMKNNQFMPLIEISLKTYTYIKVLIHSNI